MYPAILKRRSLAGLALPGLLALMPITAEASGMYVRDGKLYDRCNQRVVLRGVNAMIYYWDKASNTPYDNGANFDGLPWFAEIAKTGANAVRITWKASQNNRGVVADSNVADLDRVIQSARDHQLIPIVYLNNATDVTDSNMRGDWSYLDKMIRFWTNPKIVPVIQKHHHNLIVNIANEVGRKDNTTGDVFFSYYMDAVMRLRAAGIHVPLMIDASDDGRDIDMLQSQGLYLLSQDPDHNLLFSVHMYWGQGADQRVIDEIAESVNMKLPLLVGEFASQDPYATIAEQTYRNGIGMLVWEWSNRNASSIHNMTTDLTYDGLTDWARYLVKDSPWSIQNTTVRPREMIDGVCHAGSPIPSTLRTGEMCATVLPRENRSWSRLGLRGCNGAKDQLFFFSPTVPEEIVDAERWSLATDAATDGSAVRAIPGTGDERARWSFTDLALRSALGNKCIEVPDNNWTPQAVQLAECSGAPAQKWTYEPGTEKIRGQNGMCLTVNMESATDGQPAILWYCNDAPGYYPQVWTPGLGGFRSGLDANMCLDANPASGAITVRPCGGVDRQRWALSGPIHSDYAGKCVDADNTGSDLLQVWDCIEGAPNQNWEFWMPCDPAYVGQCPCGTGSYRICSGRTPYSWACVQHYVTVPTYPPGSTTTLPTWLGPDSIDTGGTCLQ